MADTPGTKDLEALIGQFMGSDLRELHVRAGAFELYLSKDAGASTTWVRGAAPALSSENSTAVAAPAAASLDSAAEAPAPEGCEILRAPYLGHFYRAPKPGEANFVEQGQTVEAGTDLCLVEVMKLFTAVRAESKCVVREIYAVDGQLVQEGQALFAIQPVD